MTRIALVLTIYFGATPWLLAQDSGPAEVKKAELGTTRNVHVCADLYLAGQPSQEDLEVIRKRGIKRVVTLRTPRELNWDEEQEAKKAGLEYISIPFASPESLTPDVFQLVRELLRESKTSPTLLHCGSANRVGAVWYAYRVLDEGVKSEVALMEARQIGLRSPALLEKATEYVESRQTEERMRPGINANFLRQDLDLAQWIGRFEVESREVFAGRQQILQALKLPEGARVADVGAGTGFFSRLFAEAVGNQGWVYAVDISPGFVQHLRQRASQDELTNFTAVLGADNGITLPPASVDVVFVCDTYHHFELPQSTLASIHAALRPGGQLCVIDFERIPGQTREFIMDHVRAGKEVFRTEIETAGFQLLEEVSLPELKENYFLRFQKVE